MSVRTACSRRDGFSLVELLVVVAISLIIGGAVLTALLSHTQLTATQNRNIINRENLRDTLRFMADEIQLLGDADSEPAVLTALGSEFDFAGDIDGDGEIDRVNYSFSGSTLTRTLYSTDDGGLTWSQASSDVILDGAQAVFFTYFGLGDTVPADEDAITSIDIEIQLDPERSATSFTTGRLAAPSMATRVTLRNRI